MIVPITIFDTTITYFPTSYFHLIYEDFIADRTPDMIILHMNPPHQHPIIYSSHQTVFRCPLRPPRLSLQPPTIPCRHLPSLVFLHRDCGCRPSPVVTCCPLPSPVVPVIPRRPPSSPFVPFVPCRPPPLTIIPTTNPQSSCTPCILVCQIAGPSSSLKTAVFRFCRRGRHIFCRPVRSRAA